jgi:hypothetical protein
MEAKADCEALGKQLVKINSETVRKTLMDTLINYNIAGQFYFGAQRNENLASLFQWVDEEPIGAKDFHNWASGNPTKDKGENCAYFSTMPGRCQKIFNKKCNEKYNITKNPTILNCEKKRILKV